MKIRLDNLTIATCDAADTVLEGASLVVENGNIAQIGWHKPPADHVLDMVGCLAIPGLINGHHHLYQTLTRCLPAVQNAELFDWLVGQYPIWAGLTGEMVYTSALVGLAELVLSGCTTASDMFYVYPRGSDVALDAVVRAAADLGVRIHAGRGSMSRGQSDRGLPPDSVVQTPDEILADTDRVVRQYHDPRPGSRVRIDVMPCSPFSVTPELMRDSLAYAREKGLLCQTHLAETLDEEDYCLQSLGMRPVAYMETLGWLGPAVSFAHGIHLSPDEVTLLGQTGTGIVHCPSSNMRLASGIAPVLDLLEAGSPVAVGVDGSASNDGGNLLAEVRQALLLGRLRYGTRYTARQALSLATRTAARLLRRPELGVLQEGNAADLAIFELDRVEYAGAACHDPLGALLLCQPTRPRHVMVGGKWVVWQGEITTIDLERTVAEHNRMAVQLVSKSTPAAPSARR
ncbi:MAG: 8-oxoguanine deaminase [Cyanobacteria bacterium REEB65]|nr:8-oxoguanine deaminase [Cyanobacteria bacterium REEB65]